MTDAPQSGTLRLTTDTERLLIPMLKRLYEFESMRVSGPGSAKRTLTDVLWTLDEFAEWAGLRPNELTQAESLLDLLHERNQLLRVSDGDVVRNVTRTAETVRLLGHGYEYWQAGRPGIDAVRWLVEDKLVPFRSIPAEDLVKVIGVAIDAANLDVEKATLKTAAGYAVEAVARSLVGAGDWKEASFSKFQADSAIAMIRGHYLKPKSNRTLHNQMLVAGVGSGKTAAFHIGILTVVLEARLSISPPKTQMLIYPRTALARDQFKKIQKVASLVTGIGAPDVHFEHYSGYSGSVAKGVRVKYYGNCPDIVVTTLETLKRRLYRREFAGAMREHLNGVVLDEIHLIEGTTGTNIIRLLDRLRQVCSSRTLRWTGVSATVATPERHAATVFGVPAATVEIIEPPPGEMAAAGIVHHVFLKPVDGMSTMGNLVNATSTLVHNRRGTVGDRVAPLPKTVAFADNLDALGRWNADLRENERTEKSFDREHPDDSDPAEWQTSQRDIPYAHRFHRPFSKRLEASQVSSGKGKPPVYPVILPERDHDIDPCVACHEGKRVTVGTIHSAEELRELGRLVTRHPVKASDKPTGYCIQSKVFKWDGKERTVGTLDLCPFLQAGACFHFARDNPEVAPIPGTNAYEWKNVVRSKVHSSKSEGTHAEEGDELGDIVFKAHVGEVYDIGASRETIDVDIVLASPSLEVGVDLDFVTEEIMFKAIRNIASYRQKAGRAGREEGSDVMIVTLLTKRAVDFHYYRQPRKLVRNGALDPVPLKEHNQALLQSALYMGAWDFLALHTDLNDLLPSDADPAGVTGFSLNVATAKSYLNINRSNMASYLKEMVRRQATDSDIGRAIDQVERDLDVFLTPTKGMLLNDNVHKIADLAVDFARYKDHVRIEVGDEAREMLLTIEQETETVRKARTRVEGSAEGIAKELVIVDKMIAGGWNQGDLTSLLDTIEGKTGPSPPPNVRRLRDGLRSISAALQDLAGLPDNPSPAVSYFLEQATKAFKNAKWKAHYLSYYLEELAMFRYGRAEPSFSLLPNLFTNPYVPLVELNEKARDGSSQVLDQVSVGEALYSAIPGSWTYRLGKTPYKTLVGNLSHTEGGVLVAEYDELTRVGHQFVELKQGIAGPPWLKGKLDIYRPVRLNLAWSPKFVLLDASTGRAADEDELSKGNSANLSHRVKVPTTFSERWLSVVPGQSEPIRVHGSGFDNIHVETPEGVKTGEDARAILQHPMMVKLLAGAMWHEDLEVTEYTHSLGRSYTSKQTSGAAIEWARKGGAIGFGHTYTTEGVSLELNPETVKTSVEEVLEGVLEQGNAWGPTGVKAISAALRTIARDHDNRMSPYVLRDFLSLALSQTERIVTGTIPELRGLIFKLIQNSEALHDAAWTYSKRKARYAEEGESAEPGHSNERARETAEKLCADLEKAGMFFAAHLDEIEPKMREWVEFTLVNTFGIVAIQALQRLTGTPEDKIGYYPDVDALEDGKYRIFLYDREDFGNGSSRLLRDYLHILYIQRLGKNEHDARRLPTEDFLTILEQQLLQCPQFHTDINALAMFNQKVEGEEVTGLPELSEYADHAREVYNVAAPTWKKLGVEGPTQAWKLPLLHAAIEEASQLAEVELDDAFRATGICWNGCPECVVTDTMLLGPISGPDYVDKAVLDAWFAHGRSGVPEYESITLDAFAKGAGPTGIGLQTRVYTDAGQKRYRAVRLPFTVGVEVARAFAGQPPVLLFRDGDFSGHLQDPAPVETEAKLMALGFSRLLWYQLLGSSYLASLGRIPDAKKHVTMVFYDIREIAVDESALSERMRATLEAINRLEGNTRPVTVLSEMIARMGLQGFTFTVCVDAAQAQQDAVREFLAKISNGGTESNVRVFVKDLPKAAMHAKGMLTPAGGIHGSANLTWSGTQRNDELFSYVRPHTKAYADLEFALKDITGKAKHWKP